MNMKDEDGDVSVFKCILVGAVAFCVIILSGMAGCPRYNVWEQGLHGQAELARAVQNRQIKVQEAEAIMESSSKLAQAEIERAKGVAEANRIIGDSLKGNEAYLRYLWIHNLEQAAQGGQVIYVPTEAGLPILEAGRKPIAQTQAQK